MKVKAKLRPLERVSVQDAPQAKPERTWKHNRTHEFKARVMAGMPAMRIQCAKERIQADSKAINLALANTAKMNAGQVRTILGPKGSDTMLTPTREDYRRKNRGKSGAPLSLEALRAKEFSDKR